MSLLSHGGNFGCFTRLRFKGAYLLTTVRQILYHVAKALSGSVQFRTPVNGAQCRSLKKAALLKCLKDRNDIHEWVLGSHFGSLIDLEQEMVTYAQVRYTDLDDYVWVVCIYIYGQ